MDLPVATTEKDLTPPQEMFEALAEVCCIDWKVAPREGGRGTGAVNHTGKVLREQGIKPAEVYDFGLWWTANDWRGKQNQPPAPAEVQSEWQRFKGGAHGKNNVGTVDEERRRRNLPDPEMEERYRRAFQSPSAGEDESSAG